MKPEKIKKNVIDLSYYNANNKKIRKKWEKYDFPIIVIADLDMYHDTMDHMLISDYREFCEDIILSLENDKIYANYEYLGPHLSNTVIYVVIDQDKFEKERSKSEFWTKCRERYEKVLCVGICTIN